jgi:hypothetical protein
VYPVQNPVSTLDGLEKKKSSLAEWNKEDKKQTACNREREKSQYPRLSASNHAAKRTDRTELEKPTLKRWLEPDQFWRSSIQTKTGKHRDRGLRVLPGWFDYS